MKRKFKNFIEEHSLVPPRSKILLAVSGGVDSMVMLHLFRECGYSFSVAHCNFSLRGDESDEDEQLIRSICKYFGIEVFIQKFDTQSYSNEKGVSIQVAARELRYSWFDKLCKENNFSIVAIAHNKNDIAETILINLCRGTGMKGLTGIKPKSGTIIRPLLFAKRDEIEEFASSNSIVFRIDSSNTDVKYARNRIRHRVLPELEAINSGVVDNLYHTSLFLAESWQAIDTISATFKKEVVKTEGEEIHYLIDKLKNFPFRQVFLVEELVEYGFPASMVLDIEESLYTQSGKVFYSNTHQLVRDRDSLILSSLKHQQVLAELKIERETSQIQKPISLQIKVVDVDKNYSIPKSPSFAVLDYSKISYPLTLRKWCEGDWFIPFGMKGRKKISDFLIDQKVPLHHKDSVYVLESNGDIVWVVGFRIDDRYKIEESSSSVLFVELL